MRYDRKLFEEWCRMPDFGDYLDQNGALNKYGSKEGFEFLERKYYRMVKERIEYCKRLLKEGEDAFLCYVMAELFNRCNEDESPDILYKRQVRYYALKSLELDESFIPAKELLAKANSWVEFLDGDKDYMPELRIFFGKE